MAHWRVRRNQSEYESDLVDVQIVDPFNPFGSFAVATIEDTEGTNFDEYPRGTRLDFYVSADDVGDTLTVQDGETYTLDNTQEDYTLVQNDGTIQITNDSTLSISGDYQRRFTGYVVERRTTEQNGSDTLEVECYSFDQFLRRGTVSQSTDGLTIFEALEQIITTDTPVEWDASLVEIEDNQTLTQDYRGDKVESAIQSLRGKSANESFGVTQNNVFFFNPSETETTDRDIDNTQWLDYDIPERGKRSVNEVTVWYDGGEESVTVANGADKQDLQDKLGTNDPIGFSQEVTREDITNIDDARDVAEEILGGKEPTLTGTVTTFGLYDAEPGDVINVTIIPRGIDTEFRIAEVEYNWSRDETILTIVEKRGNQDDLLKNLSEDVKRVEMREANRDAVNNRVTNTVAGVTINTSGDVDGTAFDAFRITNVARDKLRDAWADIDTPLTISELAVGNGTAEPSRSQTSLENELERVSVTESLPDSTTAQYTADFSTTDIREIGLFDDDGDMIGRATIPDTTLTSPVTVTYTLTVDNNDSISRGVVTDSGQTAVRDTIANNSPKLPTQYAYGSAEVTVDPSDTALGNQQHVESLDELQINAADSTSQWQNFTPVEDTDPLVIENGELTVLQTCFTREAEDADVAENESLDLDEPDASGDEMVGLSDANSRLRWETTVDYTIPSDSVGAYTRYSETSDAQEWEMVLEVEGQEYDLDFLLGGEGIQTGKSWRDHANNGFNGSGYSGPDIEAGSDVALEVRATGDTGLDFWFDVVTVVVDNRFNYNFDNDNGGNGGYLDGPELYPNQIELQFDTTQTRRDVTEARVSSTWNDTTNNQYIQVSNDGGTTWLPDDGTQNNTDSIDVNFSGSSTSVDARVGISRYGSRTTATPQTGFNGQSIDVFDLFADVQAITASDTGIADSQAIVPANTIVGTTIREAGQLASDNTLLTHTITDEFTVVADQSVISSERTRWDNP